MTDAPSQVSAEQLKELSIRTVVPPAAVVTPAA